MLGLYSRLRPQWSINELIAAFSPKKNAIPTYESAFAKKFGCEYGTMFSHGRSGLYSLFKVWGLENDEVICPAYTCVVVQHAIVLSGNIPVFVDCGENSFNMDYEGIRESITEKTKAVVVTHLFGYPMDVHKVQQIVKHAEEKYGNKIFIIQDAAHSYGAKWEGELVTFFGDAAIFGSNISKMITSVFGGMVTTNSRETYQKLIEYRAEICKKVSTKWITRLIYMLATYVAFTPFVYGFVNWLERNGFLDRFVKYFDESIIDFPKDWDVLPIPLEARVGLAQLKRYDSIIDARKINSLKWIEKLGDGDNVDFMPDYEGNTYSHCVGIVEDRDAWVEKFRKKGYQLGILIEYSVPEMPTYKKFKKGKSFPNALYYSDHCINFPIWKGIKVD